MPATTDLGIWPAVVGVDGGGGDRWVDAEGDGAGDGDAGFVRADAVTERRNGRVKVSCMVRFSAARYTLVWRMRW